MGVKNIITKVADKAAGGISKLSKLSSEEIKSIQAKREEYLSSKPDMDDEEIINKNMAACSIEIFNAYLSQLKELYLPIDNTVEYNKSFNPEYNIRYFNITKWVTNKKENNLEKLVNVYSVLADEDCNIALVFNRTEEKTNVYIAVVNTGNVGNSTDVKNYKERLIEAIKGNFPGATITNLDPSEGVGTLPCLEEDKDYSVAITSNIPNEKSEKFISQTIEKLLDGIVPENHKQEYTIVLLASPIKDVKSRKLRLGEIYSTLFPYSTWSTNFTTNEQTSIGSSATMGINAGASIGKQNGSNTQSSATDSTGTSTGENSSNSNSVTDTLGKNSSDTLGGSITANVEIKKVEIGGTINGSHTWEKSQSHATGKSSSKGTSKSSSLTKAMTNAAGNSLSNSLGANFGANFARTSSVTDIVGKNEGITKNFNNFNIKHALEVLEKQMKRLDQSSALGMWDFAAYVLSEDSVIANNVAHSYLALTQGEESYDSESAINLWKGNVPEEKELTKEIISYIKDLRHPLFGLNEEYLKEDLAYNVYPSIVTATTSLSGKELAYSLNFPQKSVSGLPVIECAEFGRNVITYNNQDGNKYNIGNIFHMNSSENTRVELLENSLTSHMFVTGSTGSGKSNTIYKILDEAINNNKKILVIEPAKGEYKNVFGNRKDVNVYGTNFQLTKLLKINPFSFPKGIHVLEHMDRLVEIFNVCWPMYAGMPAVLKDAIEASYKDCGWDMITSENKYDKPLYPTFKSVIDNIKRIIDTSEFDSDNKGAYKGSLMVRLKSLTNGIYNLIFTSDEIPLSTLFDENTIIDLSRVGSTETKSLIMGLLILKLQEYRMTSYEINSNLKHLTVLEEAHNILKRTSTEQSSEGGNLLGKSVEMISNAIAEMRTYGEGFIIADQSPGLLDMSVIRNTNTKIIMRLPDLQDRELVGKASNLNNDQITELSKLPCGVAAIYQNDWIQPVLCKIDKYNYKDEPFNENEDIETSIRKTEQVKSELLSFIGNEAFKDGEKLKYIFNKVMNSNLDSKIKVDLLEYKESPEKEEENLGKLVFDLLEPTEALNNTLDKSEINIWITNMINNLNLDRNYFSTKEINTLLLLILKESSSRNIEYNDLYKAMTEKVYKERVI